MSGQEIGRARRQRDAHDGEEQGEVGTLQLHDSVKPAEAQRIVDRAFQLDLSRADHPDHVHRIADVGLRQGEDRSAAQIQPGRGIGVAALALDDDFRGAALRVRLGMHREIDIALQLVVDQPGMAVIDRKGLDLRCVAFAGLCAADRFDDPVRRLPGGALQPEQRLVDDDIRQQQFLLPPELDDFDAHRDALDLGHAAGRQRDRTIGIGGDALDGLQTGRGRETGRIVDGDAVEDEQRRAREDISDVQTADLHRPADAGRGLTLEIGFEPVPVEQGDEDHDSHGQRAEHAGEDTPSASS